MREIINIYPVLLAGGTGTRLWPVSRRLYPKQLVSFIGKDSLVQSTMRRLSPLLNTDMIRIVCGEEHSHEIARHMEEIGIKSKDKIICEPCGRNTAPAILLSVLSILKNNKDAVLCIFPADHVIKNIEGFHEKVKSAIKLAEAGYLVTFGIKPDYPETGYGYIECNETVKSEVALEGGLFVNRFVEKPDKENAKKYISSGNFFWNSGMFAFKASVIIEEFKIYQPELYQAMDLLVASGNQINKDDYMQLPDISIDYAIMEKSDKVVVLPSDFGWSDIGSWKSLYDFLEKDENHNIIDGDVIAKDTKNCFIMGRERLIATNRIENLVVVETPDSVFVSDIDTSRDVKFIVEKLKEKGRREYHKHRTVNYFWGSSTILEHQGGYKVDKLIIHPDSIFQFKTGSATVKHIIIIKGCARIIIDEKSRLLMSGESTIIFQDKFVQLENTSNKPLSIIQVETGKDDV